MPKQPAFRSLRDAMKKKLTRREVFLAEMDAVVPWTRLVALIARHFSKAALKGGRPPMPLAPMLRVYVLQNWYALSDPMAEEMLNDSEAMRRFAGIELGCDRIPDGPKGPWPRWARVSPKDAILNFRHLLERHGLTQAIFAEVNAHLADKGITRRSGTLVDVGRRTPSVRAGLRKIIDAPSSTRNKAGARDPEMSATKKGNDRYFGSEEDQKLIQWINFPTKAQVGVDADSGVVHSLDT